MMASIPSMPPMMVGVSVPAVGNCGSAATGVGVATTATGHVQLASFVQAGFLQDPLTQLSPDEHG